MTDATMRNERGRLAAMLDAYGGDPSRWPGPLAPEMAALVERVPDARRLLAEARRLDALLDDAALAAGSAVPAGLADRIVAAAVAERASEIVNQGEPAGGRVIAWPAPSRRPGTPGPVREPGLSSRARWMATAGMLAASLAIGVFAGARDILPAARIVSAIETGLIRENASSLAQAQVDPLTSLEEELL